MRLLLSLLFITGHVPPADAQTELVGLGSSCSYFVPTKGNGGPGIPLSEWTAGYEFDDSAWPLGELGIGYGSSSEPWLEFFHWDVFDVMRYINASLYIRAPFELRDHEIAAFRQLVLEVRVDDGFVAFLNGTEVARFNAPEELGWDSRSESVHPDSEAALPYPFDITRHLGALVDGTNILAIQLMNNTPNSQDVFILPELWASVAEPGAVAHPEHLKVLGIHRRGDGYPGSITVAAAVGRIYQLQSSTDLVTWRDRGRRVIARSMLLDFPVTGSSFAPLYYRVIEMAD